MNKKRTRTIKASFSLSLSYLYTAVKESSETKRARRCWIASEEKKSLKIHLYTNYLKIPFQVRCHKFCRSRGIIICFFFFRMFFFFFSHHHHRQTGTTYSYYKYSACVGTFQNETRDFG